MTSDLDDLLDDPDLILRQARERFIAAFPGRSASIASLASAVAMLGVAGPLEALRYLAHRLRETSGIAAMPVLRQKSADLEQLIAAVAKGGADPADLAGAVRLLGETFEFELHQPAPAWAASAPDEAATERILVVDEDPANCGPLRAALLEGGYRPFVVPADSGLFDAIRIVYPALVLVNVDRSGLDGHAICQHLKVTPEFATLPVVCAGSDASVTASGADDRIGSAMLRADDYASRSDDPRELVRRVTATLQHHASSAGVTLPSGLLTYEAFVVAARDLLRREAGSLVVVRLARDRVWSLTARIISNARPRDLVGRYDELHIVLCLPGVLPAMADARVRETLGAGRTGRPVPGAMVAGVASTKEPGREGLLDRLLIDADHALATAVRRGELVATAGEDRKSSSDA